MPSPPASPVAASFPACCALKRGQVTLLRGGLEPTERLLKVGILTGCFDELFIQGGVFALCFHRMLACSLQ